jgi:RNA ligase (TIGR02306 family)
MRKLASIRQIDEVKVHPNADSIELAIVGGWQCVVKKGEFKAGDLCVYFEVDSVLPVRDEYEFLRKGCYTKKDWLPEGEGFRLKTIRLRGEYSQGLALPVKLFPEVLNEFHKTRLPEPGEGPLPFDVTDILKVVKWDPPLNAQLQGMAKGNFPSFIPKTDQERAQNITREIASASAAGDLFEVTIKLDGSSCTMFYNNGELGVCSRNLQLKDEEDNKDNSFVKMFNESGIKKALGTIGKNIAIQGELMGPGIQGNIEGFSDALFFIYDVYDIDRMEYFKSSERIDYFNDLLATDVLTEGKVFHVPVESFGMTIPGTIDELLAMAEGKSINAEVREGLVFKHCDGGFSFKVISNTFLLGEK